DRLVEPVNAFMKRELAKRRQVQVSRLSGQPRNGEPAYDPKEAAAPALVVKAPQPGGGGIKAADLRKLLAEIEIPAVNSRMPDQAIKIDTLPPFDAIRMDGYLDDKEKDAEIRDFVLAKQKLLVEHLTRQPVQEEFRAPGDEAQFKVQLADMQK